MSDDLFEQKSFSSLVGSNPPPSLPIHGCTSYSIRSMRKKEDSEDVYILAIFLFLLRPLA